MQSPKTKTNNAYFAHKKTTFIDAQDRITVLFEYMLLITQNGTVLYTLLVSGTSAHVIYRNRKLKHMTTENQDQNLKSQLCHNKDNKIIQGYDHL